MDLEEVKAVIKSLLVSSTKEYSLQQLLTEFYNETGIKMPTFNYSNEKKFLMSLTDTVKVIGKSNEEKVKLVKSQKSSHIASLVERQGKMPRCGRPSHTQILNPFSDTPSGNKISNGTIKSNSYFRRKEKGVKTRDELSMTKLIQQDNQINSSVEGKICEEHTNNYRKCEEGKNIDETDFLFQECEIASLHPKMYSVTASSGNSSSSSDQAIWVPDGVKMKLKRLISCQTHGIWCCDLPDLYNQLYNSHLEYKEYGFRSLIEMVMSLNEIFRSVRPHNEDWLLFDASKPLTEEEKAIHSMPKCGIPEDIEKNVITLLRFHFEKPEKQGIAVVDFLLFYYIMYGVKLKFRDYGFRNAKDFMNGLSCKDFKVEKEGDQLIIKPVLYNRTISDDVDLVIKPDDELFHELFPDDVVRSGEKFNVLDMEKYFKIGEMVDVVVADVWSPVKFYVQLKRYENDFKSLVKNLMEFYSKDKAKYRMPEVTLQPGQVCVAFNEPNNGSWEWYRSTVIRASKNKVEVHFVDYGMDCKVKFEDVRFMHRSFFDLPAQCFAAKLSNVSPAHAEKWPLDASERFLELVSVPTAAFIVESLDLKNKIISGTLLTQMNNFEESVNMVLVKEGMASPAENKPDEKFYIPEGSEVLKDENYIGEKPGWAALDKNDMKTQWRSSETFSNNDDVGIVPKSTETKKNCKIDYVKDFPGATNTPENKLSLDIEKQLRLSWTLEKEINSLAFSLLSGNQLCRKVAQINFANGMELAKISAQRILFGLK